MCDARIKKWIEKINLSMDRGVKPWISFLKYGDFRLFFQVYKTRNAQIFYFEMGALPSSVRFEELGFQKDIPIFSTRLKNMSLKNNGYAPEFVYSLSSPNSIDFLKNSILNQGNYVYQNMINFESLSKFIDGNDTLFVSRMDIKYWNDVRDRVRLATTKCVDGRDNP